MHVCVEHSVGRDRSYSVPLDARDLVPDLGRVAPAPGDVASEEHRDVLAPADLGDPEGGVYQRPDLDADLLLDLTQRSIKRVFRCFELAFWKPPLGPFPGALDKQHLLERGVQDDDPGARD